MKQAPATTLVCNTDELPAIRRKAASIRPLHVLNVTTSKAAAAEDELTRDDTLRGSIPK